MLAYPDDGSGGARRVPFRHPWHVVSGLLGNPVLSGRNFVLSSRSLCLLRPRAASPTTLRAHLWTVSYAVMHCSTVLSRLSTWFVGHDNSVCPCLASASVMCECVLKTREPCCILLQPSLFLSLWPTTRQGPCDTWQCRTPPRWRCGVRRFRTRDSIGVLLNGGARFEDLRHVTVLDLS
jgi:hypothetical protein